MKGNPKLGLTATYLPPNMAVTHKLAILFMREKRGQEVVPEPIERPTESEERTTESVTQEYKFIFPLSYKLLLVNKKLLFPIPQKNQAIDQTCSREILS